MRPSVNLQTARPEFVIRVADLRAASVLNERLREFSTATSRQERERVCGGYKSGRAEYVQRLGRARASPKLTQCDKIVPKKVQGLIVV